MISVYVGRFVLELCIRFIIRNVCSIEEVRSVHILREQRLHLAIFNILKLGLVVRVCYHIWGFKLV